MEQARRPPFHPDALATFCNAQRAFGEIRDRLQVRKKILNVLDYGSGAFGCGRALLNTILRPNAGKLFLYDPYVQVQKSRLDPAEIVDDRGLDRIGAVDWINLSYVVSHIETEREMRALLERLRGQFPEATITIVDYTLRNKTRIDALDILDRSEAERAERALMADDGRFVDMHTRMDVDGLHGLARDAGIAVSNGTGIAPDGSHYLIEAEPESNDYEWFVNGAR